MNEHEVESAIHITGLHRNHGKLEVLRGLDLHVAKGSIYGLLGRNGCGKTTLFKIIAGLIKADQGEVLVNGIHPWNMDAFARQNVGYQAEKQLLPTHLRIGKLIAFCSQFYPAWDHELCSSLLNRFQINPKQRVHTLSLGKQRLVSFILAIAPRPDLLLLDEPAANLDVVARRELLNEVLDLSRQIGKTVVFSTHILTDVERIADQVGIIGDGKLLISAPLDDLKEEVKQLRLHSFKSGAPPDSLPEALSYRRQGPEALAIIPGSTPESIETLESRLQCLIEVHHLPLEELFIHLTQTRDSALN